MKLTCCESHYAVFFSLPPKLSSYCMKSTPLSFSCEGCVTSFEVPLSMDASLLKLCLPLCPCFPHDSTEERDRGRLNSSPQQFNLRKRPFITCDAGLGLTSQLKTGDFSHPVWGQRCEFCSGNYVMLIKRRSWMTCTSSLWRFRLWILH
jgi:hypothetical protein